MHKAGYRPYEVSAHRSGGTPLPPAEPSSMARAVLRSLPGGDPMRIFSRCSTVVVLLVSASIFPAQVASQQPSQSPPAIQVPPDLPPPVGEEMRVKGQDIDKLLAEANVVLLDVREPWELEKYGTREGYINIPIGHLEKRLNELPKDKTILTA